MQKVILASTSPFRKSILEKLGLPFSTEAPDVDEQHLEGEFATDLVTRLSEAKANAIAKNHPKALIIGSDQVALLDDKILGKPGNHVNAVKQLENASGKAVTFYTGLCLINSATHNTQTICETFKVYFRKLSHQQIENYLQKEQPYNCAGSFKSEAYGIALFDKLEGDDPNTLIGLPLIRLIQLLGNEGINLP